MSMDKQRMVGSQGFTHPAYNDDGLMIGGAYSFDEEREYETHISYYSFRILPALLKSEYIGGEYVNNIIKNPIRDLERYAKDLDHYEDTEIIEQMIWFACDDGDWSYEELEAFLTPFCERCGIPDWRGRLRSILPYNSGYASECVYFRIKCICEGEYHISLAYNRDFYKDVPDCGNDRKRADEVSNVRLWFHKSRLFREMTMARYRCGNSLSDFYNPYAKRE